MLLYKLRIIFVEMRKIMKKVISLFLSISLFIALTSVTAFALEKNIGFGDISNHWAKKYIEYLANKKIVSGTNEMNFEPEKLLTRAEFTTMIVKSMGLASSSITQQTYYQDVKSTDWYSPYVGEATKANIISGYEDSTFKPNGMITRAELAAMVVRALDYKKISTEITMDRQTEVLSKYTDLNTLSWGQNEIASMINAKIMSGIEETTFAPNKFVTRA
jgi:N-acetylmuramoyl-L-alanine amidase